MSSDDAPLFELDADDLGYEPGATAYSRHTVRGYRQDLQQLAVWCAPGQRSPLPCSPATLVDYLHHLESSGARLTTTSRALSSIAHAHRAAGHTDPTRHPDVADAWAALRGRSGDQPDHALPLMPPQLFEVVAACPTTKTWARRRAPEQSLGGARDRALLLIGFVGALRRSELVALRVDDLTPHPRGVQLDVDGAPVLVPRGRQPSRCPVRALERWLALSGIEQGPIMRGVTKANRPAARALNAESVNVLVQQAIARTGYDPAGFSAHSLRAGFITYSQLLGIPDTTIADHTRHLSLPVVRAYARRARQSDPTLEP